jgi:hypothetical protein
MMEEARCELAEEVIEEPKKISRIAVAAVCFVLVMGALAVGVFMSKNPATMSGINQVRKDVSEAVAPALPDAIPSRLETRTWEYVPDHCIEPDCKSTNFNWTLLKDGRFVCECKQTYDTTKDGKPDRRCAGVWIYPYRPTAELFLIVKGEQITPIGLMPIPAWERVPIKAAPPAKPKTETKPEPKPKKERR